MTKVAIFGAGQIGRAARHILSSVRPDINSFCIDIATTDVSLDVNSASITELEDLLRKEGVTHVINAMPFFLNEKIASASVAGKCSYIDFTEDDVMADKVQNLYKKTGLTCAVKCGLAPGFINYIGHILAKEIANPDSLIISVGALPKTVSYDKAHPEHSYNLTWSVDGLVNEYIRPCRIKKNGEVIQVPALRELITVILDGIEYEAAHTSGGVGSLVRDLVNVPNIAYMTLRYPGHYKYVRSVVQDNHGDFDKIKKIFSETFPYTDEDVIVVYANALGRDNVGNPVRRSYSNKFYGVDGLTGIQATTAGSGIAMLELIIDGKVSGIVGHSDITLADFMATKAFRKYYNTAK